MKAITLWQPWATLVAVGMKTVETRSWGTAHRGPLAIHAAKRLPLNWRPFSDGYFLDALGPLVGINPYGAPNLDALPTGCVVAVCQLVDVLGIGAHGDLLAGYNVPPREVAFGDYSSGRFGWVLEEIRRLAEPIPWPGRQRVWEFPDEELLTDAELHAALQRGLDGGRRAREARETAP